MKTKTCTLAGSLICAATLGAALFGSPKAASDVPLAFQGEVMDSTCAQAGSHSAKENAKGLSDSRECVIECLKDGGSLVLYDRATGVMHTLDTEGPIFSQDRLLEFAGQKVKIVGSVDENTGMIWHIQSVQRL